MRKRLCSIKDKNAKGKELEGKVLSLTFDFLDRKREYEKELKKLTFWEHMVCDLWNGMDVVGLQSLISPLTFSLE